MDPQSFPTAAHPQGRTEEQINHAADLEEKPYSTITDHDAIAIAEALAHQIDATPKSKEIILDAAGRIAYKLALNPNWFHEQIVAALE